MVINRKERMWGWNTSFSESTFRCLDNCCICCMRSQGVGLTQSDYLRIEMHSACRSFADRREHLLFPFLLKVNNGSCIFLSEQGRCSIYLYRPLLCRLYPFQIHVKWDGTLLWLREFCPGIEDLSGILIDDQFYDSLLEEITSLEGVAFINNLLKYTLQTKKSLSPFIKLPNGIVYSDWPTKEMMWFLLRGFFYNETLKTITPRGRLECIKSDFLPLLREYITVEALWLSDRGVFFIDEGRLTKVYHSFNMVLKELLLRSAKKQILHESNLMNEGRLFHRSPCGMYKYLFYGRYITLKRYNGEKINVEVRSLMHMRSIDIEATIIEERYIEELGKREGKYGKELVSLSVDSELYFHFLVADALELKASALAINNKKNTIGKCEMREAIMIVERTLTDLLHIVYGYT